MDLDANGLSHLVKSNFIPVVLVLFSPEVEKICEKNSINIVQLLSKFSFSFLNEQTKVKTLGEQPYDIRGFQVRFSTNSELAVRCISHEEQEPLIENYLNQVSSFHAEERTYGENDVLANAQDCAEYKKSVLGGDPTPWFTHFRWHYLRSLGITETEFFEHPVATLLITSSSLSNPNESFLSLFNEKNPPTLFSQSTMMDSNIPKFYLLLDEVNSPSPTNYIKKFDDMKGIFEKNKCHLLRINSLTEANAQNNYLSAEDLQRTESFVKDLIFRGILPSMERTVLTLNEFVVNTRSRGIGGQIRGFFGFGSKKKTTGPTFAESKPEVAPSPASSGENNPTYLLNSVESSQKRLADYLFMLQDYNEALNIYKNSSKDFLNDKSWKWVASSFEMIGLATFLLDPMRKDTESNFENAYVNYYKDNLFRFAVRTAFFCAEILKSKGQHAVAGNKLANTAIDMEEDYLCSGMLYEQAAFAFLHADSPRKYAFRLVQAGQSFVEAKQMTHAFRCFSAISPLYYNRNWHFINDEMYFYLARCGFSLGHHQRATDHIIKLLEHNYQDPYQQSSYLREFLHICKKNLEEQNIERMEIPLPAIKNDTVVAFLRDYPSRSPLQEMWKEMEESLKGEKIVYNRYKPVPIKKRTPRLSVLGEPIYVEIELSNPLQIPLQFSDLQLGAVHESSKDKKDDGEGELFVCSKFDLLLTPCESKRTRFTITPLCEGKLEITCIKFLLCSTVRGFQKILLPKKRLNDTSDQKKGVFYEDNLDLTVKVTSSMPLLDVSFSDFPPAMLQGQLFEIQMQLKNSGKSALNSVSVKMSHPAFFSFGKEEENKSQVSVSIESLLPGESKSFPVWIRAHKIGNYSFYFLFSYQSEVPNPEMKHRFQRVSKQLKVLPSIKLEATTTVSYSSLNAYLLDIQVNNISDESETAITEDFELISLSSNSHNWIIEPLNKKSNDEMFKIAQNQSTNFFFRIIPALEDQVEDESTNSFISKHSLSSNSQKDLSSIPSFDFLEREKMMIAAKEKKRAVPGAENSNATPLNKRESNLDLMLLWRTTADFSKITLPYGGPNHPSSSNKMEVVGQQNSCFIPFLIPATVDQVLSEEDDNPLRFSIECPRKVIHDFNQER
eukprot:TRINITY_DN1976_c0_g1_i3.p1 TRINITY_DN1976_c0_g1~~TRINITY_DN1976_c0_g1_i3.p1  ORF type:complete len:1121 (-),score=430.32 TRINITY_DN1976_c0_g1_i3:762-4124(-)